MTTVSEVMERGTDSRFPLEGETREDSFWSSRVPSVLKGEDTTCRPQSLGCSEEHGFVLRGFAEEVVDADL